MQPYFANQPALLGIFTVSILIWRVMEAGIDIRSFTRIRAGAKRQDRGSHVVLLVLISLGILLDLLVTFRVPATAIPFARPLLFWTGIGLIYVGMALRLYAITVLGAFFTTDVAIAPQQSVVAAGPYRYIRHPSYTGILILLLGFGLCMTNWLGLLILMVCSILGFGYRIHVEEQVLLSQLGQSYQHYMQHTKRLIPFVL